jgi:uncharacterized cupin superfamily protein
MPEEAPLRQIPSGLAPTGPGWFVVNARDAFWVTQAGTGAICPFENELDSPFPEVGIRLRVLDPGEPMSMYHAEEAQEDFLIVHGTCRLIVEEQERELRTWDLFHCPAGVAHVLVAGDDGPAVIVAVGARKDPEVIHYPVSAAAARHGASVPAPTSDPDVANAAFGDWELGRPASWDRLPWA